MVSAPLAMNQRYKKRKKCKLSFFFVKRSLFTLQLWEVEDAKYEILSMKATRFQAIRVKYVSLHLRIHFRLHFPLHFRIHSLFFQPKASCDVSPGILQRTVWYKRGRILNKKMTNWSTQIFKIQYIDYNERKNKLKEWLSIRNKTTNHENSPNFFWQTISP